jgi:hypothetical protein
MKSYKKAFYSLIAIVCGLAIAIPAVATHYEYMFAFVAGSGEVTGDFAIGGDLTLTGDMSANVITANTVIVNTGNSVDGTFGVDGTATFNGAVSVATINGINYTPGSDTDVDILTVDVTGNPRMIWDESEDNFQFFTSTGGVRATRVTGTTFVKAAVLFPSADAADNKIRLLNDANDISFLNTANGEFMAFNPTTGADFQGALTHNRVSINGATCDSAYSVLVSDYIVGSLCGSTALAVTLPTAQMLSGRVIHIKDESGNASGNNITISPQLLSDAIDGSSTGVISTNYGSVSLYSDGAGWWIY